MTRSDQEEEPLLRPSVHHSQASYNAILSNTNGNTDAAQPARDAEDSLGQGKSSKEILKLLLPVAVGIFLAALDSTVVVSTYASIGSDFNQLQNTSWIATAYLLTMTAFQPLYGKLSDIFGRKHTLLFAYLLFAAGNLWCGSSRSLEELIAARAFTGIGGGGMTTVVSIMMSDVIPIRSRGTWQGVINIIFTTGSSAGAPLGGFLVDSIGWRWAFLVQVPALIVAFVVVAIVLDLPSTHTTESWRVKLARVDFLGSLTLVLTVFFLLFALDRGGNVAWSDALTLGSLALFGLFALLFVLVESYIAREPFAPKAILLGRDFFPSFLCNFFGMACGLSLVFYVSLYLQVVTRKTAHEVGLYIIPAIVMQLAGSLGGGLVIQTTGDFYWITVLGETTLFVGSAMVAWASGTGVGMLAVLLTGFIIGSAGNSSGITTSLVSLIANAGPVNQSIATAGSYLYRSMGSVLGLSIGSALIQQTLRSSLRASLAGREDVDIIAKRVRESLTYLEELDPATRRVVLASYERALFVAFCFTATMGFCAAVSSLFVKAKVLEHKKGNADGGGP